MLLCANFKCHTLSLVKNELVPWPVWLSWLGIILKTKKYQVQFPSRAHAWGCGFHPQSGHI